MTPAASHEAEPTTWHDPLEAVALLAGADRTARDLLSYAFEVVVSDAGITWNRVLACAPEGVVGIVDHFLHLVDDVRAYRERYQRETHPGRVLLRRHIIECLWRLTTISAPCSHCLAWADDVDCVRSAVLGEKCAEHGRNIIKASAPTVRGLL